MSEYSEEQDPMGHTSGALRVPQEMMQTYDYLNRYLKREMARMLEAEGRGDDDRLAHVETGEMVVPRKLLTADPWLRSYLVRVFEDAGLDWRMHWWAVTTASTPRQVYLSLIPSIFMTILAATMMVGAAETMNKRSATILIKTYGTM